jgi:hypothetical protein
VYQKKHADGKDEHEWADEKPKVQVQIANQSIKSTGHLAITLSESGDAAKSLPGENLACQRH